MWHTRLAFHVAVLAILALFHGIANAQPVPTGPEFRVHTDTAEYQTQLAIAADAAGNFVVVWEDGGICNPSHASAAGGSTPPAFR